jgi:hypothetical protein
VQYVWPETAGRHCPIAALPEELHPISLRVASMVTISGKLVRFPEKILSFFHATY